MGIEQQQVFSHWNYFLSIEEDIFKLSRWIEIAESNYECYSLEIARLLMTAAAEVDVVAKLVCKNINPKSKADGIQNYQKEIVAEYPNISTSEVLVPRFGLVLKPWTNWAEEKKSPLWWKANNNVKHHRSEHFNQATLKNLLNSVAALLILLTLYYGTEVSQLSPKSILFIPNSYAIPFGDNWMFFR